MEEKLYKGNAKLGPTKNKLTKLLIQSFFVGSFLAFYEIASSALFVSFVDSFNVPLVLVGVGLVAAVLGITFKQFIVIQPKYCILAYLVLAFLPLIIYLHVHYSSNIFSIYLIYGSFFIVNVFFPLLFAEYIKRTDEFKISSSILKKTGFGILGGAICAGLAVLLQSPNLPILFLFSFISVVIASLVGFDDLRIVYQMPIDQALERLEPISNVFDRKEVNVRKALFFSGLSVFSFANIYCYFIGVSQQFYSNGSTVDQHAVVLFFSSIVVITSVFIFVFRIFIPAKFYRNNSLLFLLIISPLLLLLFSVLCVFLSFIAQSTPSYYILLFVSIVITYLVQTVLRSEIESPSFKSYYYSIDQKIRASAEWYIGSFSPHVFLVLSGLIIYILLFFSQRMVWGTTLPVVFQILIAIFWGFFIVKLFLTYKSSLKRVLEKMVENVKRPNVEEVMFDQSLVLKLNHYRRTNSIEFLALLPRMLQSSFLQDRLEALTFIHEFYLIRFHSEVADLASNYSSDQSGTMARGIIAEFTQDLSFHINKEYCLEMGQSSNVRQRQRLASLLAIRYEPSYIPHLQLLLRDSSEPVVLSSLFTVMALKVEDVLYSLIELLQSDKYYLEAFFALSVLKDIKIEPLEIAFLKPKTSKLAKACIIKLVAEHGSVDARQFIFNKLNIHDRYLKQTVLNQLLHLSWAIDLDKRWQVQELLKGIFEDLAVSNALYINSLMCNFDGTLLSVLEKEVALNYENVFLLLSILYDTQTIVSLRALIESKVEVNYMVELIDLILGDQEKALLMPFIENSTPAQLYRYILDNYSVEKMKADELLDYILLRDINHSSRWTKVCAITVYPKLERPMASDALVSHLFNSDEILQETAARVLFDIDKPKYHSVMSRLKSDVKEKIEGKMLKEAFQQWTNLYDKTYFLSNVSVFKGVSLDRVSQIAEELQATIYQDGDLVFTGTMDQWMEILIVVRGQVVLDAESGENKIVWSAGEVIAMKILTEINAKHFSLSARGETLVYLISNQIFHQFLFEESNLT